MSSDESGLHHRFASVDGVRLHYVEAGSGPAVLLLHGFPEFWYEWRRLLPALARAGLHPIAVDLPGYNTSDKPADVTRYRVPAVARLLARFLVELGTAPATVVGHDWGGILAWRLAMAHPDVVRKLVIFNAPHPVTFARALRHPRQWLRSAYMLLFQLPALPEWLLRRDDYAFLDRLFRSSQPLRAAFTDEDIARYKEAYRQPGALTGALNYYRALGRYPVQTRRGIRPIETPTLVLWGERDIYIGPEALDGLDDWVRSLRVVRFPELSHWLVHEAPEAVEQQVVTWASAK